MNEEQKALAQKILDQVDRQPETLYMGTWETVDLEHLYNWKTGERVEECGTTRCIAGWAVHFASCPQEDVFHAMSRVAQELGLERTFEAVAGRLLGLDQFDASRLFFEADEEEAVHFLRARIQRS